MASVTRSASATAGDHSTAVDHSVVSYTADVDWSTLGNMAASDNAWATSTIVSGTTSGQSYRLDIKNWGFSIPAGATIDGIVASIERGSSNSVRAIDEVQVVLVKAGTPSGTNQVATPVSLTTEATVTYGSSTDLWGNTLTASDVNSSSFGLALQYASSPVTLRTIRVDQVQLTVYYTEGGATLLPSLLTNSQTFYGPTVTGAYGLTPGLLTNSQTFFGPTVQPGAIALAPPLLTNSQTFFAAEVSQGVVLSPSLLTNSQIFFSPSVAVGSVTLSPTLVTNSHTFYGPEVSLGAALHPPLLTNSQIFYGAAVQPGSVAIAPGLLTNDQIFYGPVVGVGGATKELLPTVVENVSTFFSPIVTPSGAVLLPGIVINAQEFFSPVVTGGYGWTASPAGDRISPTSGGRPERASGARGSQSSRSRT